MSSRDRFCAVIIVLSLLDADSATVWLWVVVALLIALGSHFLRLLLRRRLAASMAGMGYFLVSLTLDSAALITGLLAILVPVAGAVLGAVVLGGAAVLPLRTFDAPSDGGDREPNG